MYEDKLIRQITGKIGAIKRGEISKADAKVGILLNQLMKMNKPMYDELLNNYIAATEPVQK